MYWLVALPLLDGPDRTWSTLQQISTYNAPLSTNHRFSIPELRVGTLDTLMVLSDDLVKVNALLESVVNKIRRQVRAFTTPPSSETSQHIVCVSGKDAPAAPATLRVRTRLTHDHTGSLLVMPLGNMLSVCRCTAKPRSVSQTTSYQS